MALVLVDQSRNSAVFDVVDPCPHQSESPIRKILHRRRIIEIAAKSGLYGVLVGRSHFRQMIDHQGPYVTSDQLFRKRVLRRQQIQVC